jgi:UDP-N-acetylglucosamine/UDP-N-acetylgalactosamine diphosphorylase
MNAIAVRNGILQELIKRGVRVPCPESVDIGPDVKPERISGEGVTIHGGCRIYGSETLIMGGAVLGEEAPVTLLKCQLGKGVMLKGGFFEESCLLEGVSMGSGAQVRGGCLLEERARGAHTVGLKQTILFPFVTLGSLINFCDCLMAGGTDENNHSEVGSSYIHFNYTPNQDKATPSLIGDVPRGVMLNQEPIFLGGQGGIVGPVRIAYGSVVAAGTIVRKDITAENMLILGRPSPSRRISFHRGLYPNIKKIISSNTVYISNLMALRRWYLDIRSRFLAGGGMMERALLQGALEKLDRAIEERLKRLGDFAGMMSRSIEICTAQASAELPDALIKRKAEFHKRWPHMEQSFKESLNREGNASQRDGFIGLVEKKIRRNGKDYLKVIKGLSETETLLGTAWLEGLVREISGHAFSSIPGLAMAGQRHHSNSSDSSVG